MLNEILQSKRYLTSDLRQANIDLLLAQVRGSVRERMRATGLFDHVGTEHIYASVDAAVQVFLTGTASEPLPPAVSESSTLDVPSDPA